MSELTFQIANKSIMFFQKLNKLIRKINKSFSSGRLTILNTTTWSLHLVVKIIIMGLKVQRNMQKVYNLFPKQDIQVSQLEISKPMARYLRSEERRVGKDRT